LIQKRREGSGVKHEDLGREKIEKMTIETSEKKTSKEVWFGRGNCFFQKKFHLTRIYGAN